jgi:hypothetical protein
MSQFARALGAVAVAFLACGGGFVACSSSGSSGSSAPDDHVEADSASGSPDGAADDGAAPVGSRSDGSAGLDASSGGPIDCPGGLYDPATGLYWEKSPSKALEVSSHGVQDCVDLSLCNKHDWRVPTIGELRSHIRGCSATMTGGACAVTDTCVGNTCRSAACDGCPQKA